MNGIPKYLLPVGPAAKPLIYYHIDAAVEAGIKDIRIAVSPSLEHYLGELLEGKYRHLSLIPILSISLTDTIKQTYESIKSQDFEQVVSVSLPDTFCAGFLDRTFALALQQTRLEGRGLMLWEMAKNQKGRMGQVELDNSNFRALDIRDKDSQCEYKHIWGAFSVLASDIEGMNRTNPTIGNDINNLIHSDVIFRCSVLKGRFFDCGTINEYFDTLSFTL